jgi:hypothetical protein
LVGWCTPDGGSIVMGIAPGSLKRSVTDGWMDGHVFNFFFFFFFFF